MQSKNDTRKVFEYRWYRYKEIKNGEYYRKMTSEEIKGALDEKLLNIDNISTATSSTQPQEIQKLSANLSSSSGTLVFLLGHILQILAYYCKIYRSCIIRDKDPTVLLSEYSKRVYFLL